MSIGTALLRGRGFLMLIFGKRDRMPDINLGTIYAQMDIDIPIRKDNLCYFLFKPQVFIGRAVKLAAGINTCMDFIG